LCPKSQQQIVLQRSAPSSEDFEPALHVNESFRTDDKRRNKEILILNRGHPSGHRLIRNERFNGELKMFLQGLECHTSEKKVVDSIQTIAGIPRTHFDQIPATLNNLIYCVAWEMKDCRFPSYRVLGGVQLLPYLKVLRAAALYQTKYRIVKGPIIESTTHELNYH